MLGQVKDTEEYKTQTDKITDARNNAKHGCITIKDGTSNDSELSPVLH